MWHFHLLLKSYFSDIMFISLQDLCMTLSITDLLHLLYGSTLVAIPGFALVIMFLTFVIHHHSTSIVSPLLSCVIIPQTTICCFFLPHIESYPFKKCIKILLLRPSLSPSYLTCICLVFSWALICIAQCFWHISRNFESSCHCYEISNDTIQYFSNNIII